MTATKSLLVELLVEELPPKALKTLGESFASRIAGGLRAHGLATDHSVATPFATPRRLAVHISAVLPFAADRAVRHKLMPFKVAFDPSGKLTSAAHRKLSTLGADAEVASRLERSFEGNENNSESVYVDLSVKGATLHEGLQGVLDTTLAKLPIPKLMQYQLADGWSSVSFVRPAHGLVALHGADVVPVSALGLQAGRQTQGHRFEALMSPVMLGDADHYARQLEEQGAVIASFTDRHGKISRQLHAAAARVGLTPLDDAALLDEVTALVERPNVLLCEFEADFLAVPQECLILTMKANQKYFPLLDAAGKLTNRFLVVSNITPDDPSHVTRGNERVVRPRLADARFFFDQDRKRTLESRVAGLDKVVYHNKLGTLGERVQRVRAIAGAIGRQLGGEVLAQHADRAALLAKADLLTDMVGEFPELQGVMGGYYAKHDGLSDEVAFAIEDHYKPRFAGDTLPRNSTGLVVALADKLETLVGLFGIGQLPSGDKDPFALRRHALGVIRILEERQLRLGIHDLLEHAQRAFAPPFNSNLKEVLAFIYERARYYYTLAAVFDDDLDTMRRTTQSVVVSEASARAFTAIETDAVLSVQPQFLCEIPSRLLALRRFSLLPESASLATANKRVGNILRKSAGANSNGVDPVRLVEPAERALHQALLDVAPRSQAAYDAGNYTASLQALAALKTPVDAFFDTVMVNAEDPQLRANRLALLAQLHSAMNRVADLSKLAA